MRGDWRRDPSTWAFVAATAAGLSLSLGPVAVLVLPLVLVVQVPSELARLAATAAAGVPRPRLRLGVLTLDVTSEGRPDARQTAIADTVPLVVLLLLAAAGFAVLPLPYAVAYAYASGVTVLLQSGLLRCVWHYTVFEKVRAAREERRAHAVLAAAAAVPASPAAHDARVGLLAPALARDPSNLALSSSFVIRLVMALRFEEAARELGRVAVMRSAGRRGRRRALLTWADLVLTYPDVLRAQVPKAVDVLLAGDLGCGFMPAYLRALVALRTGDPEAALRSADDAFAQWNGGEAVSAHALGTVHGIRAAALLALGRREEAAAAVAAGIELDADCAIPDVLDEAKAALAA